MSGETAGKHLEMHDSQSPPLEAKAIVYGELRIRKRIVGILWKLRSWRSLQGSVQLGKLAL
jgi:hypothetical protein